MRRKGRPRGCRRWRPLARPRPARGRRGVPSDRRLPAPGDEQQGFAFTRHVVGRASHRPRTQEWSTSEKQRRCHVSAGQQHHRPRALGVGRITPARNAATPTAPAPSRTRPILWAEKAMAERMSASLTVSTSTCRPARCRRSPRRARGCRPGRRPPSARRGSGRWPRRPPAALIDGEASDSTPMTRTRCPQARGPGPLPAPAATGTTTVPSPAPARAAPARWSPGRR